MSQTEEDVIVLNVSTDTSGKTVVVTNQASQNVIVVSPVAASIAAAGGGGGGTGPQGPAGDSAYDIWISEGNTGTEADFLASLVGQDGADGAPGADGAEGPTGATGPAGPTGPQGPAGANGQDGQDGADGADGTIGSITYGSTPTTVTSPNTLTFEDLFGGSDDGSGNVTISQEKFTQNYVANMPTGSDNIVKTFGKYKNGDTILANGKTAAELLIDAFADSVAPTPSIDVVSSTRPEWHHPANDSTISVTVNFGINNQGGSGTAVVEYQLGTSSSTPTGSWTTVQSYTSSSVVYGASSVTVAYDTNTAWASNNYFHFRVRVTETGQSEVSDTTNTTAQGFSAPIIDDFVITRSNSSITAATGTNATKREYGDVQTTLRYDVERREQYDALIDSVVQVKIGSNWREITTPNSTTLLNGLANGATQNNISLAINTDSITVATDGVVDLTTEATPHEYRVVVDSTYGSNETEEFSDINYYYSYQICFDTTALTTSSSTSDVQTVYDAFGGDDNGDNEIEIITVGTYPSNIGNTQTYTVQTSNKYMYIFYQGTNHISTMNLDGVSPTLGAFNDLGTHTLENRYGVSSTYTVYRSDSTNAINNQYLSIS